MNQKQQLPIDNVTSEEFIALSEGRLKLKGTRLFKRTKGRYWFIRRVTAGYVRNLHRFEQDIDIILGLQAPRGAQQ